MLESDGSAASLRLLVESLDALIDEGHQKEETQNNEGKECKFYYLSICSENTHERSEGKEGSEEKDPHQNKCDSADLPEERPHCLHPLGKYHQEKKDEHNSNEASQVDSDFWVEQE